MICDPFLTRYNTSTLDETGISTYSDDKPRSAQFNITREGGTPWTVAVHVRLYGCPLTG